MNETRRRLVGLGVVGAPLAIAGRHLLVQAQESPGPDPLLAYLVEDTKRNCRLAAQAGPGRSKHLRALGANVEMAGAYLLSRHSAPSIAAMIDQRATEQGTAAFEQAILDAWPGRVQAIRAEYGVALPAQLEPDWVTKAVEYVRKHGFPNVHFLRVGLEHQADRIDQAEGQGSAVTVIRQTPGNDFGPAGWAAGTGDPGFGSCYSLGIFAAVFGALAFLPDFGALGPIAAVAAIYYAIVCG